VCCRSVTHTADSSRCSPYDRVVAKWPTRTLKVSKLFFAHPQIYFYFPKKTGPPPNNSQIDVLVPKNSRHWKTQIPSLVCCWFLVSKLPHEDLQFRKFYTFLDTSKKFILIRISTFSIRYHKHSIIFEMTVLVLAENMCYEYVLRGQGISTIFDKTIKRTRNACTLDIFSQIRNYSKFDFNCSESSTYRMTQNLSCSL
jgi:hypothetical protein